MSVAMDLERFEELWPSRDQQDGRTRDELDRMAASNPHFTAFTEGGEWVRSMLQDLDPEVAPADFAYRMRVYASNHPESETPDESRGWLRWPVVTVGAAAGVTAMFMAFGPLATQQSIPVAEVDASPSARAEQPAAVANPELLAESADSTHNDSTRSPVNQPDWNLHAVSTSGNQ